MPAPSRPLAVGLAKIPARSPWFWLLTVGLPLLPLGQSVAANDSSAPGPAVLPPPPAAASAPLPVAPALSGDAERALRDEQLETARQLQREHPCGDAAFALAMVFNEQGDVSSAIRLWQEGLELPPASIRLHRRAEVLAELGEALRIQEQFDRAEQVLRESLALQPQREQTILRLGRLLFARERDAECLALLERGPAESAAACCLRGQAAQRLGRFDDARGHFETALRLDPKLAEACYGLSVVLSRLGATQEAEAYRSRFARLKDEQQAFGREFRATLNPIRDTRRSVSMSHTTVAWIYRDHGQTAVAERLWRRAAELDPTNTACRFHLLMTLQQAGRNDEAVQVCEQMIRAEPANPFHQISLGNLETRRGRTNEAGRAYEAAHHLGPDRAETCFALAQFYLRANTNLPTAARLAENAVRLAPVAPHLFILSRAAARNGDRTAALAAIERACALAPDNRDYAAWKRTLTQAP